MTAPQIPPRPIRSQDTQVPTASMEIPKIPARPKRNIARSASPNRDTYARSPLNDPSFLHHSRKISRENLAPEDIRRPPSVNLPSIGQEGMEYASLDESANAPPEQTKNVSDNLPLHQPKASLPASTAKSRIQTVTRTDSSQAAAVGIGKLLAAESEKGGNTSSAQSDTSNGTKSRPQSILAKDDDEHGIPEIGLQVPMYPNAGDVQAPTPSPYSSAPATGVGFFNNGGGQSSSRQHVRTKSGRQTFVGPPGSYGMHGHGVMSQTQLEKTWYEKHPQDAAREKQGEYGPAIQDNRKEYHMSKEDLNKLVHQPSRSGKSSESVSTPGEEIGYLASEEFASRMASPRPASRPASISGGLTKHRTNSSQAHAESPLRSTFPGDVTGDSEQALEAELDDDVIHIDPPLHSSSRSHFESTESLSGTQGASDPNSDDDTGYETPILASDEVAKRPHREFLQPAVSPEFDRRGSGEYSSDIPAHLQRRPKSRGNNGGPSTLSRVISDDSERVGTPLEDVQEYEPLFPEDEGKPKTAVNKVKRPDVARHHFPSRDVWEDTPSSLQLETTVESPDAESERKPEPVKSIEVTQNESFLPSKDKRSKSSLPAHLVGETSTRPGLSQRFPSQDIWEEAPEHAHQYTTVETPDPDEPTSATEEKQPDLPSKPSIPARPARSKLGSEEASPVDKKAPVIPDRPKPQVPARPAKQASREQSEDAPLTKTVSGGDSAAIAVKAKPAVPARPGGKIASLKAGFLSDLNSKLGLGPQAPKKEEEPAPEVVEEKAPLTDARKGRAKGPQRRKPASSPSPATAAAETKPTSGLSLSFAPMITVFSISDDGINVPSSYKEEPIKEIESEPTEAEQPALAEPALPVDGTAEEKTGQQDIKINLPDGTTDEATAYIGGKASGEGNVVVDKEGVEHVSGGSSATAVESTPVVRKEEVEEGAVRPLEV